MQNVYDQVLQAYNGSASKLAAELGESVATVCNWRSRGIPVSKAQAVSKLTGISVRVLRPNDWAVYWPDLERPA